MDVINALLKELEKKPNAQILTVLELKLMLKDAIKKASVIKLSN